MFSVVSLNDRYSRVRAAKVFVKVLVRVFVKVFAEVFAKVFERTCGCAPFVGGPRTNEGDDKLCCVAKRVLLAPHEG